MTYEEYLKDIKEGKISLIQVPNEYLTYEMCLEGVKQEGWTFSFVPEEHETFELCLEAIKKNAFVLDEIPEKHKTFELCFEAIKQFGEMLEEVPRQHKILKMCIEAVKGNAKALEFVPINIIEDHTKDFAFVKPYSIKRIDNLIEVAYIVGTKSEWLNTTETELIKLRGDLAGKYLPILKYKIKEGLI